VTRPKISSARKQASAKYAGATILLFRLQAETSQTKAKEVVFFWITNQSEIVIKTYGRAWQRST